MIDSRPVVFMRRSRRHVGLALIGLALAGSNAVSQEAAPATPWPQEIEVEEAAPPAVSPAPPAAAPANTKTNTTVIERAGDGKAADGAPAQLRLVALLTDDGQQIDQGLIWRIYQSAAEPAGKTKLVAENREASPTLKLPAGDYTINASFGRAHITRKVSFKGGAPALEQFVLNAGGLRLTASVGGKPTPPDMVTYSIYSDDRDQFAHRTAIMAGAKPNLIMRLNAGIYRLVSTYGDANARVETDVTVEAGKLTEANLVHAAGKATFRLVARAGGEALPDTHWTLIAANGDIIKESVGALPTHTLAPGDYNVTAKSGGQFYKQPFAVKDGETVTVEVLRSGEGAAADGEIAIDPSLEIKSP